MSSHYIPFTKIPTLVFPTSAQASRHVALMIESLIRQNNSANRPTVLGLATGSTPGGPHRELSRPRRSTLARVTRRDGAGSFFGEENVPHQAITMGVGTILEARKVVIMAFGEHKAPVVRRAVEEETTEAVSASFLQRHPDTTFILDHAAAGQLYPGRLPWRGGSGSRIGDLH